MDSLWDDSRLDKPSTLLKYNVHSFYQNMGIETIKIIAKHQALPCALIFYNLNGDINVGMAIRSAAIFGFSDVYIIGKRHYDKRSVVGAQHYISVHRHANVLNSFFKDEKIMPIMLEQGGDPLEDFSFRPYLPGLIEKGWKLGIIVGSENHGLSKDFMKSMSGTPIVSISQCGIMRSLNVCNAASIVMYEYAKQWRANVIKRI